MYIKTPHSTFIWEGVQPVTFSLNAGNLNKCLQKVSVKENSEKKKYLPRKRTEQLQCIRVLYGVQNCHRTKFKEAGARWEK
jgi:hypothetical protein